MLEIEIKNSKLREEQAEGESHVPPPPTSPTKIRTILKGIPVLETQEDLDKASFMSQILYIFDCLSLNNALKVKNVACI